MQPAVSSSSMTPARPLSTTEPEAARCTCATGNLRFEVADQAWGLVVDGVGVEAIAPTLGWSFDQVMAPRRTTRATPATM